MIQQSIQIESSYVVASIDNDIILLADHNILGGLQKFMLLNSTNNSIQAKYEFETQNRISFVAPSSKGIAFIEYSNVFESPSFESSTRLYEKRLSFFEY